MKQIPNILSALRIVMIGVFVGMFVTGQYLTALFVFALSFLTDILDGWLARSRGWITDLGKLLDPVADKLMMVSALCCIAVWSRTFWFGILLLLALCKEGLLLLGGAVLLKRKTVVSSDWAGKIAAGLYAAGIATLLAGLCYARLWPFGMALLVSATLVSYAALAHYAYVFLGQKAR